MLNHTAVECATQFCRFNLPDNLTLILKSTNIHSSCMPNERSQWEDAISCPEFSGFV
jgi:hypothetical protein